MPYTVGLVDTNGAPITAANPLPIVISGGGVPQGAVSLFNGSINLTNQSGVATLTGTATTTVYLAGFEVNGAGATAGLGVGVTVAGVIGGTRTYAYNFETGAAVGNQPLVVQFTPPIPAAAVNTPIVITCPASGAGGLTNSVNAHGFYL